MTRALYPLLFKPVLKSKIWGGNKLHDVLGKDTGNQDHIGESWEISGVPGNISVVENGFLAGNSLQELVEIYMGDLVGDSIFEKFGIEFPLLIKFIDATDILSIQVHPDDALARKRHNTYGKTEMWYIIEADPGAEIIVGFNRDITRKEYLKHLKDKTLRDILNIEHARKGDVFFIPPGRVHAIGAGILLTEIQQTSDITYRIYDWDRTDAQGKERELHTDLAMDAIDFKHYTEYKTDYTDWPDQTNKIIRCKYFSTQLIHLSKPMEKDYYMLDSFVIYIGLEGKTKIIWDEGDILIEKGKSLLIPATIHNVRLEPLEKSRIIEVYIH
ncbi:MAG: mannose-6-phosphate isomerase [Chlorobi bacterium]|nr:mannose-6-phosphate isomerase [Chlorobiota bacterium]